MIPARFHSAALDEIEAEWARYTDIHPMLGKAFTDSVEQALLAREFPEMGSPTCMARAGSFRNFDTDTQGHPRVPRSDVRSHGSDFMRHSDFTIGAEFWCGSKRWRCADIGTRVITAICLEPREMVEVVGDRADRSKKIERRFLSDDPRGLEGPPYGIAESVFDEYDMEACSTTPNEDTQ